MTCFSRRPAAGSDGGFTECAIEQVADWINQIYEFESRGLKSTDFWEKADAAWSQGKDAEALLLTLHGNGKSKQGRWIRE